MNKLLLLIAASSFLLYGVELSTALAKPSERIYAIQLLSSKTYEGAMSVFKKLPIPYHEGIAIYQVGDYYAARYIDTPDKTALPMIIGDFKRAGFSNPVVFPFNPQRTPLNPFRDPVKTSTPSVPPPIQSPKLDEHDKTRLMLDAQKAYDQGDITQSIIYYEMMTSSGNNDRTMLLNLAYLYGKEGSSHHLERLIENKRGIIDYLYAYGIGALENRHSNLYNALSPYLAMDKSGRLAMLCGYHFEYEGDLNRSHTFYKMAYDANPSDPHILYAYARSIDIQGNTPQALFHYNQITQLGTIHDTLRTAAQSRIRQLRSMQ